VVELYGVIILTLTGDKFSPEGRTNFDGFFGGFALLGVLLE
jgi:hypothetical protein